MGSGAPAPWFRVALLLAALCPLVTLGVLFPGALASGPVAAAARHEAAMVPRSPPALAGDVQGVWGVTVPFGRGLLPQPLVRRRAGLPGDEPMRRPSPRVTARYVYLGGREIIVPGSAMALRIDGVEVPTALLDGSLGGASYIPLKRLPAGQAYQVWAAVQRRRQHRWDAWRRAQAARRAQSQRLAARPMSPTPVPAAQRLASAPPVAPAAVVPYTASEVWLMARVVHAEADGQPFDAKLGVAAVIVNRLRAPGYPKTIAGVIFEPGQFQGVGSPLFYAQPSAADFAAVRAALQGQDPTGGALHFYNPAMTWPESSIFQLPVLATFGELRFAR